MIFSFMRKKPLPEVEPDRAETQRLEDEMEVTIQRYTARIQSGENALLSWDKNRKRIAVDH